MESTKLRGARTHNLRSIDLDIAPGVEDRVVELMLGQKIDLGGDLNPKKNGAPDQLGLFWAWSRHLRQLHAKTY